MERSTGRGHSATPRTASANASIMPWYGSPGSTENCSTSRGSASGSSGGGASSDVGRYAVEREVGQRPPRTAPHDHVIEVVAARERDALEQQHRVGAVERSLLVFVVDERALDLGIVGRPARRGWRRSSHRHRSAPSCGGPSRSRSRCPTARRPCRGSRCRHRAAHRRPGSGPIDSSSAASGPMVNVKRWYCASTSPIAPLRASSIVVAHRRSNGVIQASASNTPASIAGVGHRRAVAGSAASGFSHSTCLPAAARPFGPLQVHAVRERDVDGLDVGMVEHGVVVVDVASSPSGRARRRSAMRWRPTGRSMRRRSRASPPRSRRTSSRR